MLGKISTKENVKAYPSASYEYYRVIVLNDNEEFENLLITEKELERIRKRVSKNPEDILKESWFDRLFVFLNKLKLSLLK